MGSVNSVTLVGNLARDPETRQMQSGDDIVNMTVVTSESWRDKATGERKERAEFHKCVIFNPHLAKIAAAYLKKGSKLYLTGALQTRKWTDTEGRERYSTEVVLQKYRGELVLLDSKSASGDNTGMSANGDEPLKGGGDMDSDIPFGPCVD